MKRHQTAVLLSCLLHIINKARYISSNLRRAFFRADHNATELEAYLSALCQLRALLHLAQRLLYDTPCGHLCTLQDAALSRHFVQEYSSMHKACFYGRCLGFQSCAAAFVWQRPVITAPTPSRLSATEKDCSVSWHEGQQYLGAMKTDSMENYATHSKQATVLRSYSTSTYCRDGFVEWMWGWLARKHQWVLHSDPRLHFGKCWPIEGDKGQLHVQLAQRIRISHVTLGHITPMQSPFGETTTAPKHFSVYGMKTPDGEEKLLGRFFYDNQASSFQTFALPEESSKGVCPCAPEGGDQLGEHRVQLRGTQQGSTAGVYSRDPQQGSTAGVYSRGLHLGSTAGVYSRGPQQAVAEAPSCGRVLPEVSS
uniref:SUN domain-containing protein n=1 Tax=Knipowitschia caucasica TaxID=637954 RepID=A0AAV2MPP6_KNICA